MIEIVSYSFVLETAKLSSCKHEFFYFIYYYMILLFYI